jgi:Icc-related predicted phosphoesterase
MPRILYASDLHGSDTMFRKLVNAAIVYKADAIIVGGDITGKGIVPIVKKGQEYYMNLYGATYKASTQEELNELIKKASSVGFYPYVFDREEDVKTLDNEDTFNKLLLQLSIERLRSWIEYAESKLKDQKIEFYMMPGNDDPLEIDKTLNGSQIIVNHSDRVVDILNGEYQLLGNSNANITPWKCVRDIPEEELKEKLEKLMAQVRDFSRLLLNTHCPPYGTSLDLAPKLDKDLKPVVSGGGLAMEHVGCKSVREIIEKYQPLLGLHGHIHESRGAEKIGQTLILNPGSAYNEGVLMAALINIDKNKVKGYMFLKS